MSDIIQLLSETVANQIAAGEVIQRPASAVKELLENSVDAGSHRIELFIKDSGKTLIQIIDDGTGMSPTDACLAFSRHATSKIRTANDLSTIRTMGFRGEALASVAAIAHVELKSRRREDEVGIQVEIEAGEIKHRQPVAMQPGTSISVKNLFYNVPARRNFLKSNPVEGRHVIEEFERVAYANPEIYFSLVQNGIEIFRLPVSNLRQRIVNINGSGYNERLVPVSETTSILSINGFVGKPEFSRKTRGEQFFFVNNRFIKDGYLHHAVVGAFEGLLASDSIPSYWIYIDIDPSRIDVNIHPTKTEIKFEDERSVYSIVRAAVKRSLGQYSVAPAIDFETERTFDVPHGMRYQAVPKPSITINTGYNPFQEKSVAIAGWQKNITENDSMRAPGDATLLRQSEPDDTDDVFQQGPFIVCKTLEGILLIHATAALERILYQRFIRQLESNQPFSQQSLFPQTITFTPTDFMIVKEIENDLRLLGFDLQEFGDNSFAIQGIPTDIEKSKEKEILESIVQQYKQNTQTLSKGSHESLARSMARSLVVRRNILGMNEMKMIIRELRSSERNARGLDGKPCMILLKTADLAEKFK